MSEIPNGFFRDESAIGYNAWSILETGKDEYSSPYPVFFRCFDNFHEPVMVYTLVPLIKFAGLTKSIVRSTSAFYMILASIVFFFLVYQYTGNRWISLLGGFLFSILPWAFPLSRTCMAGYTPMLLGINLGWLFILKAFGKKSHIYAIIAAFGWAFAMYSHNCGRPMTAVLLLAFFAALNMGILKRLKVFLTFSVSIVIIMIPMILYVLNNPVSMTTRFKNISVWHDNPAFSEILSRIAVRYLQYFSPGFLFFNGDTNLRHSTGSAGVFFLFMAPFIMVGLFVALKYFRRNFYYRFALLGVILYPIAGILTIDSYHSTRTLNGMAFWCIIFILGLRHLYNQVRPGSVKSKKDITMKQKGVFVVFLFLIVFSAIEIPMYFEDYFNKDKYVNKSRIAFDTPSFEALEIAFQALEPNETLYLSSFQSSNRKFKPFLYSQLLFLGMIPPETYQKEGIPENKVCIYKKQPSAQGVLVRASHVMGRDKKIGLFLAENVDPIPKNHKLIGKVRLSPQSIVYYEIYKINAENNSDEK